MRFCEKEIRIFLSFFAKLDYPIKISFKQKNVPLSFLLRFFSSSLGRVSPHEFDQLGIVTVSSVKVNSLIFGIPKGSLASCYLIFRRIKILIT